MVGQNIGRYRVIDRVGRGGMGTVFRAVDETLSREVAIKILNAELNDPEVARRFRAEAVTVARLNHPGIATIYELFQHDGQWMMVMEFVRGETLEHMVERLGALSPQRAADLCMQGLAALSHAHRMGVVHRDLKPANLMITESGAVKIMDFGIARVAGSEHLTSAGFLMGTPAYMAPEQVTGDEIDARTDLYAFGVVFYYLVTARLPFKGETPMAMAQSRVNSTHTPVGLVREGLPAWIEPLVDRALSKAPAERFQSADQFREALRRGLAGLPMETLSGGVVPPELVATAPPGSLSMPSGATSSSRSMPVAPPPTATSTSPGTLPSSPVRTATTPVPPANTGSTAKSPTAAPLASKKAAAPINRAAIALGAAVIMLGLLVAWMWLRHRAQSVPPPEATTADASTAPATPQTPTPTPTDVPVTTPTLTIATPTASTTPAASPATPSTTSGRAAAASTTPTSSPSTTPRAGTAAAPITGTTSAIATTPTPAPSTGRGSAADTEHVAFSDVKYLTVRGQHADDEDAVLNFVAGQISVTSKKGGPALVSDAYRRIVRATYVHAKMPKWDPSLPAPMDGFDVPGIGFLRPARNWLVLQTRSDFVILRLDDSNWQQIVDTFEARTGLKVDRPPATER